MRLQGFSESDVERIERDVETATTQPKIDLALDFARRVSRSNPPPGDTDKQALRDAGYDDTAIKEIAFQAADVIFHNRMGTLLALPLDDHALLEDKGLFATLRDEFKHLFAQTSTPSKPEKLSDELKTGPYSNVVIALDGIIQARMLRTIIDEAWASPHLPTRTKALIFAVIARGLGSKPAEEEAYRLLGAEGLAPERVDMILAHLSAPELDEIETRILPYVRETIWYQAPTAQRRGRELRAQLSNEQFLETVGIAALANMVCRLPLVLDAA
jgi:alkylhydroperoxidase family enzyme